MCNANEMEEISNVVERRKKTVQEQLKIIEKFGSSDNLNIWTF